MAASQMLLSPGTNTPLGVAGRMAEAGDVWLTVQSAVWESQSGAAVQDDPMPPHRSSAGGPRRLQVELKMQNRGKSTRILSPRDFRLRDAGGTAWSPAGWTIPLTPLAPRAYWHGVLAFVVPETAPDLLLVWSQGGREAHVKVKAPPPGWGDAEAKGQEVSSCLPTVAVRCGDRLRPPTR